MSNELKIANAQGFWGDTTSAAATLLSQQPDIDVLTLDYLAEVTMSILARQMQKDPTLGYARDFVDVVRSVVPFWKQGCKARIVTNSGGLNPGACGRAVQRALRDAGMSGVKIGIVGGDDVLDQIKLGGDFPHLETGQPISTVLDRVVTANAYVGAAPVVEALAHEPLIVVTGRVADPSLTVAPCMTHFGWKPTDYDRIAGATIAGHLLECGTQVTGGISTDWMTIERPESIGFPVIEIDPTGSLVVTKPSATAGRVNLRTVKEQLLYEIGDPDNYISPDAVVSFLSLKLDEVARDRVRVSGARGRQPTDWYKVTATYRAGFRAGSTLTIIGRDAAAKARRAGQVIHDRLCAMGLKPQKFLVEAIGSGDTMPGVLPRLDAQLLEATLRVSCFDSRREVVEQFSKEIVPLVTSGPQGTTGYFEGRPSVREVYGYWPCLIERSKVQPTVEILEV